MESVTTVVKPTQNSMANAQHMENAVVLATSGITSKKSAVPQAQDSHTAATMAAENLPVGRYMMWKWTWKMILKPLQ